MTKKDDSYDWASSLLSIMECDSVDFRELAKAADLSPENGDLIDIDLSNLDLRRQNFSGWNLSYASFANSFIAGANFDNAKLDASAVIEAKDWESADLPYNVMANAQFISACTMAIEEMNISESLLLNLTNQKLQIVEDIVRTPLDNLERSLGSDHASMLREAMREIGFSVEDYTREMDSNSQTRHPTITGSKFYYNVDYKKQHKLNHKISYTLDDESTPEYFEESEEDEYDLEN